MIVATIKIKEKELAYKNKILRDYLEEFLEKFLRSKEAFRKSLEVVHNQIISDFFILYEWGRSSIDKVHSKKILNIELNQSFENSDLRLSGTNHVKVTSLLLYLRN